MCVRGHADNPYVKYTTSSSSLLTRREDDADVLAPHLQRLHHTCYGKTLFLCKFLQRQGIVAVHSSQIRSLQYYSREIREEAIITQMGYAGPGSSVSECRPVGMIATLARFAHVNILHRSGSSSSTSCFQELVSTIQLSYLSICHTNTWQTVKYRRLVNCWYSSGAIMFARLSVSCRYT